MTPNNPDIRIVPFPISPHLEEIIRQQKEIEEWVKNNVGISSDRIGEEKAPKIVPEKNREEDERDYCDHCRGINEGPASGTPCPYCKNGIKRKPKEYEPE